MKSIQGNVSHYGLQFNIFKNTSNRVL